MITLGEAGPIKRAIGLMSGTSMDGVDAAILDTDGVIAVAVGTPFCQAYNNKTRALIKAAMGEAAQLQNKAKKSEIIAEAEAALTAVHIECVQEILLQNNMTAADIDVLGFHGQTIVHRPQKGWTWQIGDAKQLAQSTQIPVVYDFRSHDMHSSGEGAPLAPLYHAAKIKEHAAKTNMIAAGKAFAILNLGGVGNVTWVKWQGDQCDLLAFDTGPGNALMDDWTALHTGAPYDEGGYLAAVGRTHPELLTGLLDSPYFDESPPKSLDRDDFSIAAIRGVSTEDGASTLLDFTIESIALAQVHFTQPVSAWYVTGGGVHNSTLMQRLRQRMPVMVQPVSSLGWNAASLEAEAFAFLAVRSMRGLPLSLPKTTGCIEAVSGGTLIVPDE